jgi:CBS domain-containing protein
MITVAELMTTDLYTLSPTHTLADARKLMAEHYIRHIPVLDAQGNLKGVVSQRDVLAASESSLKADGLALSDSEVLLASFMTSQVTTVDGSADLRGAALFLQKEKVGCLPVVEDGKLIGIITDSDYVGIAINLMEQLEDAEPEESF